MVKYKQRLDAVFRALADPTRRAMLEALAQRQASVSQLAAPHSMSLPAVMKHLRVLESAGLVSHRKTGRSRRVRLAARPLQRAATWLQRYQLFWNRQFDSLDRYLEREKSQEEQPWPKPKVSPETTLHLTRTFAAPRDRVFRAWTQPEELAEWFKPTPDHFTVVPEFDLRVGGRYRVEIHHKGGNVHNVTGTYREIKPPERLVFSWHWENDSTPESVVTVEFRDLGPSTEVHLTHEHLPSTEERDKHLGGWTGCVEQLALYLSK